MFWSGVSDFFTCIYDLLDYMPQVIVFGLEVFLFVFALKIIIELL